MSSDIIQHASVAGELAPNMWGRTDFEKYDVALAQAHNWVVDYRGPLLTREGYQFGDILEWTPGHNIKAIKFEFSDDLANTYLCVFYDDKVRFIQNNAYVLEDAVAVASLANSTGDRVQITANAHGYSNGDWVKLAGFDVAGVLGLNTRTVRVANKTTNTFNIKDPITGDYIEIASVPTDTGSVYRIYTISSPYGEEDLPNLEFERIRDYVRLTHGDHPPRNLIRNGHTSWTINSEVISAVPSFPTNVVKADTSFNDFMLYVYHVTAVDIDGNEGPSGIVIADNCAKIVTQANNFNLIRWTAVSGAVSYRIYRSSAETLQSKGVYSDAEVGFTGETTATVFSDTGFTPDNTRKPPIIYNPFANGAIRAVTVTTPGTGYTYLGVITWPSGGSGAHGWPIASNTATSETNGPLRGIYVQDGGEGYTGTSITVSVGSGFAGVAVLSPASGNNPRTCCSFQQRIIYAATDNYPLRIFGSRQGSYNNFNYTAENLDDDSFEFDISSPSVTPINHIVAGKNSLVCFTPTGVYLVYANDNKGLSGNNPNSDRQDAPGASRVRPIWAESVLTYISESGQAIYMLLYDDYKKGYAGENVSELSNHLFHADWEVESMDYAQTPSSVIYTVQNNGRMLATTVNLKNGIFGTTPLYTKGYFRHCAVLEENRESRLYVFTERMIQGERVLFFERQEPRDSTSILENAFCVDAGLRLEPTYPAAWLTPSSATGSVTFTASASVFSAGDVGKVLRCGSGRATISGYTDGQTVTGTWTRDLTDVYPETSAPAEFAEGFWTLDAPITEIRGLWHLEGQEVVVLADGVVITGHTVTNGMITLATAASRIVVGLLYTCIGKTLPPTVTDLPIEGRRKRVNALSLRQYETFGLKIGHSLDSLYPVHDQRQALSGSADALRTEMSRDFVYSNWTHDEPVYLVQDSPCPAGILNFIRDLDLGDDKE